jgi:hypothetical protein
MKIARAILYTVGILFILLTFINWINLKKIDLPKDETERIAYYGYNIFLIIGIVFILIARSLSKKIRRKKEKELLDSLPQ